MVRECVAMLPEHHLEIIRLRYYQGLSYQEIADLLFLSKRTVDKHRENLLNKTGSRNTSGLVIYAIKNGIIDV